MALDRRYDTILKHLGPLGLDAEDLPEPEGLDALTRSSSGREESLAALAAQTLTAIERRIDPAVDPALQDPYSARLDRDALEKLLNR